MQQMSIGREPTRASLRVSLGVFAALAVGVYALAVILLVSP
jgi:hypothetical protein